MVFAFIHWSVSWRVEVLIEGLLSVEYPTALLTFEEMSWGIEVLLQCPLPHRRMSLHWGEASSDNALLREQQLHHCIVPIRSMIVGIGRIAEALALRGSELISGPHGLSEDRDLEHGWLPENPGGPEGIFEIGCEERLCTFWRSSTLIALSRSAIVKMWVIGHKMGNSSSRKR
jgi:hypothetical protein